VATATEAFGAQHAGVNPLKFFPAVVLGEATTLKAWLSVIPVGTRIYAVGGMDASNQASFGARRGWRWHREITLETRQWDGQSRETALAVEKADIS
jgi:hypothetical protein